ncbi:ion transporter [Reichenbachiella ulvae]|uniref:Ion transporter n=1 Tax=Reichenbachiella ulvae TaxID=2980104 RepID=A0ABT3CTP0_9BACT|nr:ion transporter [Reichenbachiella ulvae]MCV9386899.1 ion transporter [Reichenbachiella ulvae]
MSPNTREKSALMIERIKSALDKIVPILIVVSIIDFSLSTLPDLNEDIRNSINLIEQFIVIVFSIEYIFNLMYRGRIKYAFSFYGVIDLLAILPYYLALGLDLRSIRLLRFFRVFRLLKLTKYTKALKRLAMAFDSSKEELIIFSISTLVLLYLAGVGIYYFENPVQPEIFSSVFDGLWWAVATLTTVGYGDAYPVTAGGKFFTFIILMLGLGIVAVPTGIVSSSLSSIKKKD